MIGHCLPAATLTQPSPQSSASTALTATTKDKPPQHQGNVPFTPAATARKKDSCTVQRTVGHCEGACLPQLHPPLPDPEPQVQDRAKATWNPPPPPPPSPPLSNSQHPPSPGHKDQDAQARPLTTNHRALATKTKTLTPDYPPPTTSPGNRDQDAQTRPLTANHRVLATRTKTLTTRLPSPRHRVRDAQAAPSIKSWAFKPKSYNSLLLQATSPSHNRRLHSSSLLCVGSGSRSGQGEGRVRQPPPLSRLPCGSSTRGGKSCVWCAKKDEAKKSEHEQTPLHGVPGRDRLSSRERRGTKMSKSVEVEECRSRRAEGRRRRAKHEEKQGIIPQGGEVVEGGEKAKMVKKVKL
jgi:hypothetical protein